MLNFVPAVYMNQTLTYKKIRLIADVTAEIFKFKNSSVGNVVKCIASVETLRTFKLVP